MEIRPEAGARIAWGKRVVGYVLVGRSRDGGEVEKRPYGSFSTVERLGLEIPSTYVRFFTVRVLPAPGNKEAVCTQQAKPRFSLHFSYMKVSGSG